MKNIIFISVFLFVVILSGCGSSSSEPYEKYSCNCSKTCPNISSCAEAQYQLNECGCSVRDGDGDGIACDADCQ